LVNSFSSADLVKPIDLSKLAYAPEWVVAPKPPIATAGQHRFVWDLHYAPPAAFKDDFTGSWAPPGKYTVELDVDGKELRQPFEIAPDPRISVSPAAFQAQFALAQQVQAARVKAQTILKEADALRKTLKGNAAVNQQIDAIIGTAPPTLGSSDFSTVLGVSDRLDALANAVESADAGPSPDELRSYATLSASLDALEKRWAALRGQLPAS
jgi:hypothetical protein